MKQSSYFITKMMISLLILIAHSDLVAQTSDSESGTAAIDMQEARATIESIVKQFSDDYRNGDSLAVAAHYAKDAQFGSLKGDEILAYWGRSIRKSIKNDTQNLMFTTTALTGDSEFLVELGVYEIKDSYDLLKAKGKYVVVWKQENGEWKMYRDIGL